MQHFLSLDDLSLDVLQSILDRAIVLKNLPATERHVPLLDKSLAMIFNKSSTRTRVSFEVAMRQLGGGALTLSLSDSQMGRGESIEDTARVISSMVDAVMIRTNSHQELQTFAAHSSVPVINGLTDDFHPCQLLADLMTVQDIKGEIKDMKAAWIGDGNNVCHSWMNAARIFGFHLAIATPAEHQPSQQLLAKNAAAISLSHDAEVAASQADVVVTDTWASMGQESEKAKRQLAFKNFTVDAALMSKAKSEALFMHCLPAYRGSEVSADVIDGPQSVVFQEAENRLHAQKALLEYLIGS